MFNIHNCVCDYPRNIAECPAVCPGIYRYKLRAQAVTVANIDIFENCFAETKVYIIVINVKMDFLSLVKKIDSEVGKQLNLTYICQFPNMCKCHHQQNDI